MKTNPLLSKILLISGMIEILLGILHFVMPTFVVRFGGFLELPKEEKEFIILLLLALGILLVAFGTLTVYFARKVQYVTEALVVYLLVKSYLWIGRVGLELFYPVEINLFSISPFTKVALPLVIFETILFIAAATIAKSIHSEENLLKC